jgi:transaldolase
MLYSQLGSTMRFFLDTANLEELRIGASWGILDGCTTNPSLIAKEGIPIAERIKEITEIVDGDISAEVVATDADGMLKEGRELAKIHKNIVVKVPLTRDGIKAC